MTKDMGVRFFFSSIAALHSVPTAAIWESSNQEYLRLSLDHLIITMHP